MQHSLVGSTLKRLTRMKIIDRYFGQLAVTKIPNKLMFSFLVSFPSLV
jgi:hypothetical protein